MLRCLTKDGYALIWPLLFGPFVSSLWGSLSVVRAKRIRPWLIFVPFFGLDELFCALAFRFFNHFFRTTIMIEFGVHSEVGK